ncbi:MAG TPA: permease-like cell division protein FtsX [Nitrospiria bacterium]|nr:permease-like cell division protein FtsX [Nitrospiria bacterium]
MLWYYIEETIDNLKTNRLTAFLAILTLSLTLVILEIFILLYYNLESITHSIRSDVKLVAFLSDDLSQMEIDTIKNVLAREKGTAGIRYVSKEKALEEFKVDLKDGGGILKDIGENPLPASFELKIVPSVQSDNEVRLFIERIKGIKGIEEISFSMDWINNLNAFLNFLKLVGLFLGSLLGAGVITIISNTIKLTIYSRSEEIEIMRLMGATNGFIKIPFLLEGSLMGSLGAGISLSLLAGIYTLFRINTDYTGGFLWKGVDLVFLPPVTIVYLFLLGTMLGCLGSGISLKRFL